MQSSNLLLVTLIAEDELEARLLDDLKALGARGYTVCRVRGEGAHGQRFSQWEGENVKIELIVDGDMADAIGELVEQRYFQDFAVIYYLQPVQVLREAKFSGRNPDPPSEPG